MELASKDLALLDELQRGFPVVAEPYAVIADRLGITEREVRERVMEWRESGLLRRLGAVLDSRRLGYRSTLVAMAVPGDRIEAVAAEINAWPGVTHNYLREAGDLRYNLWFTLTVRPEEDLAGTVARMARVSGISDFLVLPATRLFKIDVRFKLGEGSSRSETKDVTGAPAPDEEGEGLSDVDRRLVALLSEDLPVVPRPFAVLASRLGESEDALLERIRRHVRSGVIRRFGATLKHFAVGLAANAMVVWQVPAEAVEGVGEVFAACDAVSHCYARPTYPDWPFNLYTMVHSRTRDECVDTVARLAVAAGLSQQDYRLLFTARELKKERMYYGG